MDERPNHEEIEAFAAELDAVKLGIRFARVGASVLIHEDGADTVIDLALIAEDACDCGWDHPPVLVEGIMSLTLARQLGQELVDLAEQYGGTDGD